MLKLDVESPLRVYGQLCHPMKLMKSNLFVGVFGMQNEFASSFAAKAGSRCSGNEGFDFALPMEREHPVVQLHFVYFVMVGAGLDEMREAEF